jgi:hypothetical protein
MSEYWEAVDEMQSTLEEILPFDEEYDLLNGNIDYCAYNYLRDFSFTSPICTALFHQEKQKVYVYFKVCPGVHPVTKVKFTAKDMFDAGRKTSALIEDIMLHARSKVEYMVLVDYVERNRKARLSRERREVEQVG